MISLHYDDVSIAIAVLCMLDTQTDILQFSRSSLCTVYIRATYDALFRTYIAHRKDGIIIRISLNNGIILGSADPKGLSKTGFRITYLPFMRVFETFLLHSSSNLNFQKHGLRCLKKKDTKVKKSQKGMTTLLSFLSKTKLGQTFFLVFFKFFFFEVIFYNLDRKILDLQNKQIFLK